MMNIFPEGAFPDPEQVKIERILKAERWQELAEHYGTAASMVNPYLGDEDGTSFLRQLEQLESKPTPPIRSKLWVAPTYG